jgi:uncharacterized membrane protein
MPHKILFRHRAHEVSRIEAFSDVVFGFAMSLLVVSLEAPKTYHELLEMLRGALPFAFCFFVFIMIWWEHHRLFKRYALHDATMISLNTVLLFVLLVYVYPLKFMAQVALTKGAGAGIPPNGYVVLFTIYGIGYTLVFWLLAAMFWHAYRCRDKLALNEVERIDTRERIYDDFFMGCFGLLSTALVHSRFPQFAGLVYFLIAVPKTVIPMMFGAKRAEAEKRMLAGSSPQSPGPGAPEQGPRDR